MILLGDFTVDDNHIKSSCKIYDLKNLIEQPTSYKNPSNPLSIDLILTNVPRSFQSTCVMETRLPDIHLMNLIVMRNGSKNFQPIIINYRSYKHLSNEA